MDGGIIAALPLAHNLVRMSLMKLSIAIVSYHSHLPTLKQSIDSVVRAVEYARHRRPDLHVTFFFIDNDPAGSGSLGLEAELEVLSQGAVQKVIVINRGKNLGYGAGHNTCLEQLQSDYHLILNPDVILADDALFQGLSFLDHETDVVIAAPYVEDGQGRPAYLCKRYPTAFDLWLRGFMPLFIQRRYQGRLDRYQMKDVYDNQQIHKDIPIVSGCCMLLRTRLFKALDGFDEKFFLYFEDFDLSLRAKQYGKVAYYPAMRICHLGGFSARKGVWHIQQFIRSGKQFFDQHGWKWF
jgi:GT2 family glycosyltransferase